MFGGSSNLFGGGGSTFGNQSNNNNSVFGGAGNRGMFGQQSNTQQQGGLFGNSTQQSGGGLFGNNNQQQQQQQGGGLFGSASNTSGPFGSSQPQQNTGSAFGTQTNTGGGLFGGGSSNSGGGGLFGSSNQQQSSGGVFGSSNTSGQSTGGGLFGAQPQQQSGGLFGSSAPAASSGGGLFGRQTNTGGGLFGGGASTTNAAPFGSSQSSGGGLFGSSQTSTGGGLFGSSTQTQSTSGNLFGKSATTSAFGTTNQTQSSSLFGSNQPATTTGTGLFGGGTAAATQKTGTQHFRYQPTVEPNANRSNRPDQRPSQFMSISMQPEANNKSLEELRLEDYINNNRGGGAQHPVSKVPGVSGSGQSGGLFGAQQQSSASTFGSSGSMFGGGSQPSSLFGGQQQQTQPQGGGGLFGSQPTQSGGLFGSTSQPSTGGGLFGSTTGTSGGGLFGQPSTSGGLSTGFGTQTKPSGGLFGSSGTSGGGGLFGASQPTGGTFGSSAGTNTGTGSSLFGSSTTGGGGGLFGSSTTNTAPQSSLFGSGTLGGGGLGGNNRLGTTGTGTSGGLFGSSTGGGGGLFGSSGSTTTGSSLFGSTQTGATTGGGLFGSTGGSMLGGGLSRPTNTSFGTGLGTATSGSSLFGSSSSTGLFGAGSTTGTGGALGTSGAFGGGGSLFGSTSIGAPGVGAPTVTPTTSIQATDVNPYSTPQLTQLVSAVVADTYNYLSSNVEQSTRAAAEAITRSAANATRAANAEVNLNTARSMVSPPSPETRRRVRTVRRFPSGRRSASSNTPNNFFRTSTRSSLNTPDTDGRPQRAGLSDRAIGTGALRGAFDYSAGNTDLNRSIQFNGLSLSRPLSASKPHAVTNTQTPQSVAKQSSEPSPQQEQDKSKKLTEREQAEKQLINTLSERPQMTSDLPVGFIRVAVKVPAWSFYITGAPVIRPRESDIMLLGFDDTSLRLSDAHREELQQNNPDMIVAKTITIWTAVMKRATIGELKEAIVDEWMRHFEYLADCYGDFDESHPIEVPKLTTNQFSIISQSFIVRDDSSNLIEHGISDLAVISLLFEQLEDDSVRAGVPTYNGKQKVNGHSTPTNQTQTKNPETRTTNGHISPSTETDESDEDSLPRSPQKVMGNGSPQKPIPSDMHVPGGAALNHAMTMLIKKYENMLKQRDDLPRLPPLQDGYYTRPSAEVLMRMDSEGLTHVKNFVVGRHGYGQIVFLGTTDIRGLDLQSIISIDEGEVAVYEHVHPDKKPHVGEELNKPSLITLENEYPEGDANASNEERENYQKMLQEYCENDPIMEGTKFVEYNIEQCTWTFQVPHFSRWGRPDKRRRVYGTKPDTTLSDKKHENVQADNGSFSNATNKTLGKNVDDEIDYTRSNEVVDELNTAPLPRTHVEFTSRQRKSPHNRSTLFYEPDYMRASQQISGNTMRSSDVEDINQQVGANKYYKGIEPVVSGIHTFSSKTLFEDDFYDSSVLNDTENGRPILLTDPTRVPMVDMGINSYRKSTPQLHAPDIPVIRQQLEEKNILDGSEFVRRERLHRSTLLETTLKAAKTFANEAPSTISTQISDQVSTAIEQKKCPILHSDPVFSMRRSFRVGFGPNGLIAIPGRPFQTNQVYNSMTKQSDTFSPVGCENRRIYLERILPWNLNHVNTACITQYIKTMDDFTTKEENHSSSIVSDTQSIQLSPLEQSAKLASVLCQQWLIPFLKIYATHTRVISAQDKKHYTCTNLWEQFELNSWKTSSVIANCIQSASMNHQFMPYTRPSHYLVWAIRNVHWHIRAAHMLTTQLQEILKQKSSHSEAFTAAPVAYAREMTRVWSLVNALWGAEQDVLRGLDKSLVVSDQSSSPNDSCFDLGAMFSLRPSEIVSAQATKQTISEWTPFDELSDKAAQESTQYSTWRAWMRRREAVSLWLENILEEDASLIQTALPIEIESKPTEISDLNITQVSKRIFYFLCLHDVDTATQIALQTNLHRVAMLLPQTYSPDPRYSDAMNAQYEQWRRIAAEEQTKLYPSIPEEERPQLLEQYAGISAGMMRIYALLAGRVTDDVVAAERQHWRTAFGLSFWYSADAQSTVAAAIDAFRFAIAQNCVAVPRPWYDTTHISSIIYTASSAKMSVHDRKNLSTELESSNTNKNDDALALTTLEGDNSGSLFHPMTRIEEGHAAAREYSIRQIYHVSDFGLEQSDPVSNALIEIDSSMQQSIHKSFSTESYSDVQPAGTTWYEPLFDSEPASSTLDGDKEEVTPTNVNVIDVQLSTEAANSPQHHRIVLARDLSFNLLSLYAHETSIQTDDIAQSVNSFPFDPNSLSESILDVAPGWHTLQLVESLHVARQNAVAGNEQVPPLNVSLYTRCWLARGYIEQLELCGQWEWAVFVALDTASTLREQLTSSNELDVDIYVCIDQFESLARQLCMQHYSVIPNKMASNPTSMHGNHVANQPDTSRQLCLVGVPNHWLDSALSMRWLSHSLCSATELEHCMLSLLRSHQFITAHATLWASMLTGACVTLEGACHELIHRLFVQSDAKLAAKYLEETVSSNSINYMSAFGENLAALPLDLPCQLWNSRSTILDNTNSHKNRLNDSTSNVSQTFFLSDFIGHLHVLGMVAEQHNTLTTERTNKHSAASEHTTQSILYFGTKDPVENEFVHIWHQFGSVIYRALQAIGAYFLRLRQACNLDVHSTSTSLLSSSAGMNLALQLLTSATELTALPLTQTLVDTSHVPLSHRLCSTNEKQLYIRFSIILITFARDVAASCLKERIFQEFHKHKSETENSVLVLNQAVKSSMSSDQLEWQTVCKSHVSTCIENLQANKAHSSDIAQFSQLLNIM